MKSKDILNIEKHLKDSYLKTIIQLLKVNYNITPEQFIESCLNSIRKTPKLLECDIKTLFGAMMCAAEVGLKPDTSDQHCFLIPRFSKKNNRLEANFELGYKGLIEIMYRNPKILKVFANAVYKNDSFDYGYGIEPFLEHKPHRGEDRGELDAVYCVVKFDNQESIFTVVEKHELISIQNISSNQSGSSAYNNGKDVFNFMQIKAAIKKISKLLPKQGNEDIARAVEIDSQIEGGETITIPLPNSNEVVKPKVLNQNNEMYDFSNTDDESDENSENNIIPNKKQVVITKSASITQNKNFDNEQNAFKEVDFETNSGQSTTNKTLNDKAFDIDMDDDDYEANSKLF